MNAKIAKQLEAAPKGNRSAANDPSEQQRYLKGPGARRREALLRQFMKGGSDGPRGNSAAYLDGWDRIFGGKHKEGEA